MYKRIEKNHLIVFYRTASVSKNNTSLNNFNRRFYHCGKQGVYGYRCKQSTEFTSKIKN